VKKQQVVAAALFTLVVVWMVFPRGAQSTNEEPSESEPRIVAAGQNQSASEDPNVITVRAANIRPQTYVERIRVRGQTQAYRHVEVRAEQAGRIVGNPIARGARVEAGDVLCEIAVDNRAAELNEARSRLEQAEFEYRGAQDLRDRDLQSAVAVAQYKAAVDSAKAAVTRAELALEKTRMVAPFAGVVEQRQVEVGDLLNVGAVCASVLDDSPMLLVGLVPESDVSQLSLGASVTAELINGDVVEGVVTYVARAADPVSRSYRIEAEVATNQGTIRDGITAELMVETDEIQAHLIPSSALTLDDNGDMGVKTIDSRNVVHYERIEIIGDNTGQLNPGIWVSGLSGNVTLITVGQEIVFPGQVVEANFDWSNQR